ncbi:MAG: tetratricopeptide repeat protein [Acidobacteriota bacterium]|nr:tetratricopeptide repeat protein [Acidobacteriota bacterium]
MSDEVRETAAVYQVEEPLDPCVTPPPIPADLLPLIRLLEYADGFTLAFLVHNVPVEADRLVDLLLAELASRGRPGRVVRLRGQAVDLLSEIERVDQEPNRPLFVLGFERSIPSGQEFPPALTHLNMARENFRDLPFPVVLVLPDYALTKLAREAQDFWAWRSGVFEVPSEALEPVGRQTIEELIDSPLEMSRPAALRHLRVLESLLAKSQARQGDTRKERLDLHRRLGALLHRLGDDAEAASHLKKAVTLARELPARLALAECLGLLSRTLAGRGDSHEALSVVQESVHLWGALASENPQRNLPFLADSLDNFANQLAEVGEREKALEVSQEAVSIVRALASENPGRHLAEQARSLNNLSGHLSRLGRQEEALDVTLESVELLRALAREAPERYAGDLAAALRNLSLSLSEIDRFQAALAVLREAAEIYRRLFKKDPHRFGNPLARSLIDLAVSSFPLGDRERVVAAAREALQIPTSLMLGGSLEDRENLAIGLFSLYNALTNVGDDEAAYAAIWKRVEVDRSVVDDDPDHSAIPKTSALSALAELQLARGESGAARETLLEAVELVEPVAIGCPDGLEHLLWERLKQKLENLPKV